MSSSASSVSQDGSSTQRLEIMKIFIKIKLSPQNKISFHIKRSHGLRMTEYNSMHGTSLVSRHGQLSLIDYDHFQI